MVDPEPAQVVASHVDGADIVLTPDALSFLTGLHRTFEARRQALLAARIARQVRFDGGEVPTFRSETAHIRRSDWRVEPPPPDLEDRRVEITGPAEPRMMINALNSGAQVFMADLEDALSPTWGNVVGGHAALIDAARRQLTFDSPDGKSYRLNDQTATLVVRPRGWHLEETHVAVDGSPISASLFDFGLFLFHNWQVLLRNRTGPYFYLPKLESAEEACLWKDVFIAAEDALAIPRGHIRVTVLIETILAAFEMDEILFELRDYAVGLNAGRWDYLFSAIKKFRAHESMVLPDRSQLTMTTPFMRAYTDLLVATCHRRGAHAIGGMAAFIPSRRDPTVNDTAMSRVRDDKERESRDGFDGTWVAHPDLVPLTRSVFDIVLGDLPHQKDRNRDEASVSAGQLVDLRVPGGRITVDGARLNVSIALQYINAWLQGRGATAINSLMEDVATAEISRSQLWQWRTTGAVLDDGSEFDAGRYRSLRDEELEALGGRNVERLADAADVLDALVLEEDFTDFLTLRAYPLLA